MKHLIILFIPFILFSCEKDETNDLKFFDVNGKAKSIKSFSYYDYTSPNKLKDTIKFNSDDFKFFKRLTRNRKERIEKNNENELLEEYNFEVIKFDSLGFFKTANDLSHSKQKISREKAITEIEISIIDKDFKYKGTSIKQYSKSDSLIEINYLINYEKNSRIIPLEKSIMYSGTKVPLKYRVGFELKLEYDEINIKSIKNRQNLDSILYVYSKNKLEYLMYILEYDSLNNWTDRMLISNNFKPIFETREIDYYLNNNK